jgi:hypothetical protein
MLGNTTAVLEAADRVTAEHAAKSVQQAACVAIYYVCLLLDRRQVQWLCAWPGGRACMLQAVMLQAVVEYRSASIFPTFHRAADCVRPC